MLLKLTIGQDNGSEISSLVLPVSQKDYIMLSAEELAQQYITPCLESLRTDSLIWERICRMGGGVTTHEYGPA